MSYHDSLPRGAARPASRPVYIAQQSDPRIADASDEVLYDGLPQRYNRDSRLSSYSRASMAGAGDRNSYASASSSQNTLGQCASCVIAICLTVQTRACRRTRRRGDHMRRFC